MTTVNSIAGNDGFSKIENTVVNSQDVTQALANAKLVPLKAVVGTVTPTAAGNYAVVGADGGNVAIPLNALVSHIFLRGSSDLAGGTNAVVALGATVGTATPSLTAAVVLADLLLGESPAVLLTTGDPANAFVSLTTLGIFSAGSIEVTVLYL